MATMLNDIYQKDFQAGKTYLPNPFPAHKLVIPKQTFRTIMRIKGWKSYEQAGKAMGFTRQYVAMIVNGTSASSEFIIRLALALGNVNDGWNIPFKIVPRGEFHSNHPTWNQQKHDGQMPYEKISIAAELRRGSYPVEKKDKYNFEK